jgi:hypothetical protein
MTRKEFGSYEWAEAHHYDTARKSAMVLWQLMKNEGIAYRFRRDYFSIEQMGEMLHKGLEADWAKEKSIHSARMANLWFEVDEKQGRPAIAHRIKHLWEKYGKA